MELQRALYLNAAIFGPICNLHVKIATIHKITVEFIKSLHLE